MRSLRHLQAHLRWLGWSLLLAALLMPAGLGHLDLCACGDGEHGALCATDAPAQPVAPRGCCSERPAETAAAPRGEPCGGCPSLDLAQTVTPRLAGREHDASPPPTLGLAPRGPELALVRPQPSPATARPRPPPRRLHHLLNVVRQ